MQQPAEERAKAFLFALAIGLDRSDSLRKYAVMGDFVKSVESEEERAGRLESLGSPTLRGRQDLMQHFLLSAAIQASAGTKSAEAVGLAKELHDASYGSGFSFADWCADLSGISLRSPHTKRRRFAPRIWRNDFRSTAYCLNYPASPRDYPLASSSRNTARSGTPDSKSWMRKSVAASKVWGRRPQRNCGNGPQDGRGAAVLGGLGGCFIEELVGSDDLGDDVLIGRAVLELVQEILLAGGFRRAVEQLGEQRLRGGSNLCPEPPAGA